MTEQQKSAEFDNVVETVVEMLNYRGYSKIESVPLKHMTGFSALTKARNPVFCIIASTKTTPKDMYSIAKQAVKGYDHMIVVHEHQQSKTIKSHFAGFEDLKLLETIHFDHFIINKVEHFGTEKSVIVAQDDEDFANFLRISGLQQRQLPIKKTQDPMMTWLGAQHGDIILTTRMYNSNPRQHIYEFVSGEVRGGVAAEDSDES